MKPKKRYYVVAYTLASTLILINIYSVNNWKLEVFLNMESWRSVKRWKLISQKLDFLIVLLLTYINKCTTTNMSIRKHLRFLCDIYWLVILHSHFICSHFHHHHYICRITLSLWIRQTISNSVLIAMFIINIDFATSGIKP